MPMHKLAMMAIHVSSIAHVYSRLRLASLGLATPAILTGLACWAYGASDLACAASLSMEAAPKIFTTAACVSSHTWCAGHHSFRSHDGPSLRHWFSRIGPS